MNIHHVNSGKSPCRRRERGPRFLSPPAEMAVVSLVAGLCALVGPIPRSRVGGGRLSMVATPLPMTREERQLITGPLAPEDEWIRHVDMEGFRADVLALGRELKNGQGEEDVQHLHKLVGWSNFFGALGMATVVFPANPVTIAALSLWSFSRWTMIAHHTCHGGYNGHDERFASQRFAVGSQWRRALDWFDWMLPEAWNVEHNNLHHYRLGEGADPDLVERNLVTLREMDLPFPVKRVAVAMMAAVWKWWYYAPNTYKVLTLGHKSEIEGALTLDGLLQEDSEVSAGAFMRDVMGPYLLGQFVLRPLPFVAAGAALGFSAPVLIAHALINLALADVLCNLHSFLVIATNHAGADLYKFAKGPARVNSATWLLRSVISSANFRTGGDVNDFLHGWLNYQIEHHVRVVPRVAWLRTAVAHGLFFFFFFVPRCGSRYGPASRCSPTRRCAPLRRGTPEGPHAHAWPFLPGRTSPARHLRQARRALCTGIGLCAPRRSVRHYDRTDIHAPV